jgi:hypothetical protein
MIFTTKYRAPGRPIATNSMWSSDLSSDSDSIAYNYKRVSLMLFNCSTGKSRPPPKTSNHTTLAAARLRFRFLTAKIVRPQQRGSPRPGCMNCHETVPVYLPFLCSAE